MDAIANIIEKILNQYLKFDPAYAQKLSSLQHKVVAINISDWHLTFFLLFKADHIDVLSHYESTPDAIIRSKSWTLFKSDLVIEGDSDLAYEVHRLLKNVDVDWEEQLSKVIGDIPAHSLANTAQHVHAFIKKNLDNLRLNITEYAQFEKEIAPSKKAVDDFADDVRQLEMDVERLEAKVRRLGKNK